MPLIEARSERAASSDRPEPMMSSHSQQVSMCGSSSSSSSVNADAPRG
eukprot:CAMPEP_0206602034 /NCGR_PEP_ID=MMETSP0325_2-20121206/47069_1 /ASSEMBLY_ACC=CAM_ASM_000347 /TAXON_ID=2866 /ORGANISM="Crypthecodinium cohnii, Strain Seligo" /LENGTH=47 /DNA_ID= /DNA_START= /DNA_END= /DNA_ORIENTATION=